MALITPLKGSDSQDGKPSKGSARGVDDGPPPSTAKPKVATPKGSLFQQSSGNVMTQNAAGLGPEGGNPQVIANQALAQVLSGVKILSTVLPGIVPILSDLTGRLEMIVPQMMADMTNGGTGLVPSMGMPLPQPGQASPMVGGPMGAPPGAGQAGPPMGPINPMGPGGAGMPPPPPPPGMFPR